MNWLLADYGIQWTVLGVLRQFYTLREHGIKSKIGAGEYGLQHMPPLWQPLIQEAINIRQHVQPSLFRSRVVRAVQARAFLQLIISACNTKTEREQLTNGTRGADARSSSHSQRAERGSVLGFASNPLKC